MYDISTLKLSAEAGYATPNVNTVYSFGFMDLVQEPVILTLPNFNGRYYMVDEVLDAYTNAVSYPAGKDSGYDGGIFINRDVKKNISDIHIHTMKGYVFINDKSTQKS